MPFGAFFSENDLTVPPIFISYASRDQEAANRVVHALEARGLKCWMSSRDIPLGQDYQGHIVAAIEAARVMLVLLSRHSAASKEVPKETALASEINRTMIPVRLDAAELTGALRYQAASAQRLDLSSNFEARIDELARQLAAVLDTQEATEHRLRALALRRRTVAILVWPVAIAVVAVASYEAWRFAPHPQWLDERLGNSAVLRSWQRAPAPAPSPPVAAAPAAVVSPPPPPPDPDARVTLFVQRYYAALSGPEGDIANFIVQSVADPIQYYGRALSRRELVNQQVGYAQRWPERSFNVRTDTLRVACANAASCTVSGIFDYTLHNAARRTGSSGTTRFDMRVSFASAPRLVSLSTVSLERHQLTP